MWYNGSRTQGGNKMKVKQVQSKDGNYKLAITGAGPLVPLCKCGALPLSGAAKCWKCGKAVTLPKG